MNTLRPVWKFAQFVHEKGFFHLLSTNFLVQFLGFGSSLLVTKFITPEEFGQIRILQSYILTFSLLAGFGLNSATLKFGSENRSKEEREALLFFALRTASISVSVTLLLLVGLSITEIITSSRTMTNYLLIFALVIPFQVATDIFIVYLQANKRIKEMARAQGIIKLQSFVLIVIATWLYGLMGFIIATILAVIVGLLPLLRLVGWDFLKQKTINLPQAFFSVAIFSLLANGVATLRQFSDLFILDHFALDRAEIGFYSLATLFIQAAMHVTGTVQSITTPYFSERALDLEWFKRRLLRTQTQMFLLSIFVAVSAWFAAWTLIKYFYGPAYSSSLTYLAILLLRYIIWSGMAIIGVGLFALERIRYNFLASLLATITGFIASYLFLLQWGITGVAWAQVLSAVVNIALTYIFFYFLVIRKPSLRQENLKDR
jgi:O-antigen/teichoic acid export membrane protein